MWDHELVLLRKAKHAEALGNWREAAKCWTSLERHKDANACVFLAESIERGASFRLRVLEHAGPEPEVCGDKEDSISWMRWFKLMNEVTY